MGPPPQNASPSDGELEEDSKEVLDER